MKRTDEDLTLVARAMEALGDPRHVPFCVAQLAFRPGRDAIRRALVAMGAPAHDALEAALEDPKTDRRVRTHIPWTLAELGTQRAADDLMARLERESDGFVRYKVLRALGHLVATHDVVLDRARIERQVRRTLVEHLRVTALRVVIEGGHPGGEAPSPAFELLVGILQNKQSQSLERAFRLLKIAHKQEDIHRVHAAATSGDRALRSHAGEFLDALLAGRGQRELRALFRLVVEDLTPAERVARARAHLGPVPAGRDEALASLIADHDEGVATLASNYALSIGAGNLRATIARARRDRPSLDSLMERCTIGSPRTGTAQ